MSKNINNKNASENHKKVIEYSSFENPYTGLAAMILVQAAWDFEELGERDVLNKRSYMINRYELINFFRSPWASMLASSLNIPQDVLKRYAYRR